MALRAEDKVQCSLDFAIVDEVDSILIDEARTPLIISGPSSESPEYYEKIKKIIPTLKRQSREETEEEPLDENEKGDYLIDEKMRSVDLTDDGYIKVEKYLEQIGMLNEDENLYSAANLKIMRYVQATLKANYLFIKMFIIWLGTMKCCSLMSTLGEQCLGEELAKEFIKLLRPKKM